MYKSLDPVAPHNSLFLEVVSETNMSYLFPKILLYLLVGTYLSFPYHFVRAEECLLSIIQEINR